MDPKLVQALVERITAGLSRDDIKHEMLTAGYNEATFTSAYEVALARVAQAPVQKPADSLVDVGMDIGELFKMSFKLFGSNFSILVNSIATLLVSTVVVSGIGFVVFNQLHNSAYDIALVVVGSLAFIVVMVTCFASIVRALLRRNLAESFSTHLTWTFVHIIGITLVSCYISVLTQVGYMFFIIPGIALNIFLIFSTLFVIAGTHSGVAALVASTELVYGRFFKVLVRVLLSGFAFMTVVWGGLILSVISLYFSVSLMVAALAVVFIVFCLGFFWQICFTVALFEALQNSPVVATKPISTPALTLTYRIIVSIGMAGLIIFAFLFGFFAANSNVFEEIESDWIEMEAGPDDVAYKQTVRAARLDAEFYRMEQGSFLGVCTHLTLSPEIVCESTDILYALETPLSEGFYCVDSAGYEEVNPRPILFNASCLNEDSI